MPNDRPAIIVVCVPIDPDASHQPPVTDLALREAETIATKAGSTGCVTWWTTLHQLEDDDLDTIKARGLDPELSWLLLTAEVR